MDLLENIFLGLTVTIPATLLLLMITNFKRIKRNKKYRNNLLMLILASLIINGSIFGGIKMYNDKKIIDNREEKRTDNIDKDKNNEIKEFEDKPKANTTSKGFTIENKNGVTYIDGHLVVNKTYPLPEDYIPSDTHKPTTSSNCLECIINEGYDAYTKMKQDASGEGMTLWIASGYRSYSYQNGLYTGYVKRSGKEAADTYSARPGHSEHQSGYAFDLNSINDSFANTKEGKWINQNCYRYGFIIRYPKGKEDETGYKYEPWHLRYVGVDLATKLYNAGDWLTMEDYFGITSQYRE